MATNDNRSYSDQPKDESVRSDKRQYAPPAIECEEKLDVFAMACGEVGSGCTFKIS